MLKECCIHSLPEPPLNTRTLRGSPSVLTAISRYLCGSRRVCACGCFRGTERFGCSARFYLGLDIINNVREVRDSLHRMADDFRIRNARLANIRSILGTNSVLLHYSERFQLLSPTVNIEYLRPYRLRTPDIGSPPKSLSAKPVEPVTTLGSGVNSSLLLRFKLLSGF